MGIKGLAVILNVLVIKNKMISLNAFVKDVDDQILISY